MEDKKTYALILERLDKYIELLTEKLRVVNKGFDFRLFETFKTLREIKEYCETYLENVGDGSGRLVYLLSSRKVIKIAKNKLGLAQNLAEVEAYRKVESGNSGIYARIFDYDRTRPVKWIVAELVRELKNAEEFLALTGFDLSMLVTLSQKGKDPKRVIRAEKRKLFVQLKELQKFPEYTESINDQLDMLAVAEKSPLFLGIFQAISNGTLDVVDLATASHWGKTVDGRVVLLDYGLSKKVREEYFAGL